MSIITSLSITLLSICVIIQSYWMAQLSKRILKLETVQVFKDWLSAIEAGESPSDLAYMREKGFLK